MRLVKNSEKYWEFIRNLRNNEEVKKGFIAQDFITKEDQKYYMDKNSDHYYICLNGNKPVGYIGEMNMDIRFAVLPEKQGNGIGRFMLKEFIKKVPGAYGKVKIDNEKSQRAFLGAGFKEITRTKDFYFYIKK